MDPVSVTLGLASLAFQVFAGCVQAYQVLSEARGWRKEYQYLRVRLKTEQCRLLDWAYITQLTEREETLLISKASRGVLVDILDQQRRLLLKFGRLDDRLLPMEEPLICEEADEQAPVSHSTEAFEGRFPQAGILFKKSLDFVKKTTKCPTGLRWVMSDRAKVEELVKKLSNLNDFLKELLNGHQLEMLTSRHVRTDYQIMQLNSRLDYLEEIVASCSMANSNVSLERPLSYSFAIGEEIERYPPSQPQGLQPLRLVDLAQFKVLSSAINTNTLTEQVAQKLDLGQSAKELTSVEISLRDITLINAESTSSQNDQRVEGWYKRSSGAPQRVWIEWKECDPHSEGSGNKGPDPRILRRLKALVALLRENRTTDQFKAPHCLGYFLPQAEDNFRVGLVFENPPGTDANTKPVSLLELMQDQSRPMASLTSRVALAKAISECLERLHAVNWLHKGIRSHNVLFFHDKKMGYDFSKPYLSGFDYSRPAQNEDMTERPPENPAHDLYRHPLAHGNARDSANSGGFKRQYDIYSLGVVLIEIAYWKPIFVIVGMPDLNCVRSSETVKVRQRLLHDGFLPYLRGQLGDTIPVVIQSCLEGLTAFGIPEGTDETDAFVGARLQAKFYDLVVKQLQSLKI